MDQILYTWVLIPLLIFIARIFDVSLGTIRVIFISRGFKFLAPALGFFEVLIWLMVIRHILLNLANPLGFIAYAAGFAAGTFTGIIIEGKLSVGKVIIRIHTKRCSKELLKALRKAGYSVTSIDAENNYGKIKVLYAVIRRQSLPRVVEMIKKYNHSAFYSIEDVRYAMDEKVKKPRHKRKYKNVFGHYRKGK